MVDPGFVLALLLLGLFGALLLFALWLAAAKKRREAMHSGGGLIADPGAHIDGNYGSFGGGDSGCHDGGGHGGGGDGGACH